MLQECILNTSFGASVATHDSKIIKNRQKVSFLKVYQFSNNQHFQMQKHKSGKQYSLTLLAERKVVTKSFICQIMIVNEVTNIVNEFSQYFA